ncbi:ribose 5-phosphate isomerase B [Oligoflexus tunisiensis]|uniref:ribose 5-phosphate isomerase B n=1 Tax=Oligoflexus tunisiensis TaxID=708132 RepID=UPI000A68EED3
MSEIRVTLGNDHAGFDLKLALLEYLQAKGFAVEDVGSYDKSPVDYPDYAVKVAKSVQAGARGILLCGSGIGASVAANKIPGIRAGLAHDSYSAHQGVEHDDMNILVLGARVVGVELAKDLSMAYLEARFTGADRHRRRLKKIVQLEENVRDHSTS